MANPIDKGHPFQCALIYQSPVIITDEYCHTPLINQDLDLTLPPLHGIKIHALENKGLPSDAEEEEAVFPPSSRASLSPCPSPLPLWDESTAQPPSLPKEGYTWSSFEHLTPPPSEYAPFSEAGIETFNAALSSKCGVLPQDAILPALRSLALGRGSIFFIWDDAQRVFRRTLEDVSISGVSPGLTSEMLHVFVEYAGLVRGLGEWCVSGAQVPAVTALKGCVERVLRVVEEFVLGADLGSSVLGLKTILSRPGRLLEGLHGLVSVLESVGGEEECLAVMKEWIGVLVQTGSALGSVFGVILEEVARPWLDVVAASIGLVDGVGEYEIEDKQRLVDAEDERIIRETKVCLDLVREHFPEELVSSQREVLEADCSSYDEDALDDIAARMSEPPLIPAYDALQTAVQTYLTSATPPPTLPNPLTTNLLSALRPQILLQAKHLNTLLLKNITSSILHTTLRIIKSYLLLNSGNFLLALTSALFDPTAQSARRTHTNLPTGSPLGLRLGSINLTPSQWPPASSELRLVLNNILSESFHKDFFPNTPPPGDLSFSIRTLSEDEINRVLQHPHSIYALDFLKVQFSPLPEVGVVVTPSVLKSCDDVFRFLVRMLIVRDAAVRLRWEVLGGMLRKEIALFSIRVLSFVDCLLGVLVDLGIQTPWNGFEVGLGGFDSVFEVKRGLEGCVDRIRERLFLKKRFAGLRGRVEDVLGVVLEGVMEARMGGLPNQGRFERTRNGFVEALRELDGRGREERGVADVVRNLLGALG
ncbi:hypothetical protein K470DRAFT_270670 [Piedraia hortae CBS 480.64]|uniref:Gamma tubulin complex component C-terminal domain-containing protein n=1 Tax=Piedraia hortae CBS 480.64 TaxID=1314780 RepID=A0A6A7BYX5_9PEZI|nr:hypothetical protein K470DRAFT_270670 [Piedraia hortae CBS 480.64]